MERGPPAGTPARGVLFGLTLEHTRADVARSLMEGVAYEIAACLEVLRRAGHTPQAIRVLGGGAKAAFGTRSRPTSRGLGSRCPGSPRPRHSAPQSWPARPSGCSLIPWKPARLNPVVCRFEPDPERQPVYQELRQRYESLYTALRPLFDEVREL